MSDGAGGEVTGPPPLWLVEGRSFTYLQVADVAAEAAALDATDPGIRADLIALIRRARRDGLGRTRVEHPLATQPEIGEIRMNARGRRYRLYFAQPPSRGRVVVGLVFAVKLPHGHPAARSAQNDDIARAANRFALWLAANPLP